MPSNVVQLREMLREKFPGVRMAAESPADKSVAAWPTGLPQVDRPLRGGLPKGGVSELICASRSCGSASVLAAILRHTAETNQIAVLIDGQDSFDPASLPGEALRHLLWVRCRDAGQALKAADFVLRDANLPFVALDLALNPPAQLRKISATTWYRFQRIIEQTSTTVLVITPQKLVSGADARLILQSQFGLESLDQSEEELLKQLRFEFEDLRRARQPEQIASEAG
jgi:hypothetical protein